MKKINMVKLEMKIQEKFENAKVNYIKKANGLYSLVIKYSEIFGHTYVHTVNYKYDKNENVIKVKLEEQSIIRKIYFNGLFHLVFEEVLIPYAKTKGSDVGIIFEEDLSVNRKDLFYTDGIRTYLTLSDKLDLVEYLCWNVDVTKFSKIEYYLNLIREKTNYSIKINKTYVDKVIVIGEGKNKTEIEIKHHGDVVSLNKKLFRKKEDLYNEFENISNEIIKNRIKNLLTA